MGIRFPFSALIILLFALGINPAQAQTLLVVGDSVVAGYGLQQADAFPDRLGAHLHQMGLAVRVVNGGVSGETSSGARTRLAWSLDMARPDAVLLATGGNDILRNIPMEVTRDNLETMLQMLSDRRIPVLLAGVRPFSRTKDAGVMAAANKYDRLFAKLARRQGVTLDPFLLDGVATNPALMQADGLHPNAAGADAMARRVAPLAAQVIKEAALQKNKDAPIPR